MVLGSSGNSRRITTQSSGKALDAKAQASAFQVFSRIGSNLIAGCLLLVSLVTLLVLHTQGLFDRHVVLTTPQTPEFWSLYGQSCQVSMRGFVKNTCSAMEMNTTTAAAWRRLGALMAIAWAPPKPWYITTCIVGPPHQGWAYVVFLASATSFPSCVPSDGPQFIDGMGMLTTTTANDSALNLYQLTLYGDTMNYSSSQSHTNSDGTTVRLFSNTTKFLIAVDGTFPASWIDSTSSVIKSAPLGSRYLVETHDESYFVDMTSEAASLPLKGWSEGRVNKKVPVIATAAASVVANYTELAIIQGLLSVASLLFLSGDVVMTWMGLKVVWKRQPVLSYDLLLGLEQRKFVLVLWALNCTPSLLYADVARVYYGTENGADIWLLSLLVLGNFTAFLMISGITLLQYLPSPFKGVIPFSTPVFLFASTISVLYTGNQKYAYASNEFLSGKWLLALNINGTRRPAGAYVDENVTSVGTLLLPTLIYPTLVSFGIAIVYAMIQRYYNCRCLFVATGWAKQNSFFKTRRLPSYISSLPLGPETTIRMGNKSFIKPSTMAVLGFATVIEKTDPNKLPPKRPNNIAPAVNCKIPTPPPCKPLNETPTSVIISTYSLVPVILNWFRPMPHENCISFNDILAGEFTHAILTNYKIDAEWLLKQSTRLEQVPVLLCHGGDQQRMKNAIGKRTNITVIAPPLPIPYGTHHTKMTVLFYSQFVRVAIFTANFLAGDWNDKTQGIWYQDFPLKEESTTSTATNTFEQDLAGYLSSLHPKVADWCATKLALYDFNQAQVILIPSVPGTYSTPTDMHKYGHLRLKKVLEQNNVSKKPNQPVVAQFSSFGSLNESWLMEFLSSFRLCTVSILPPPKEFHIVWPSVAAVRGSIEGWRAGGALPCPLKNLKPFLHKYLRSWCPPETLARTRVMPHIKTFTRISKEGELDFVLLTSANLSQAAWGCYQKQKTQFMVRSYELGVLFIPSEGTQFQFASTPDTISPHTQHFPLPYLWPPKTYDIRSEEPWSWDQTRDDVDDFGQTYEP
ncbi:tyrosyl-DNA phosphodiesterase [Thraustotheca clavata]|uniref:Tyrosyl-DNA phosphodiesterase n=1 Tax=Thraustotheca clavata TaxID=74557 RepID=A0A1V9ZNZ3_9STRA|nr:tyrosyl-DNA phosphodiesterase [Thraustotheca clavata]